MAAVTARYTPRYRDSPRLLYPEEDNGLTRAAVRLWYALAHRGALANWLDFSPTRLAPEIDMSRAGIFAALRELTMKGYIERGRIGRLSRAHCVTPTRRGP
jgi:DNA-binding MarR family transcriptional regulator